MMESFEYMARSSCALTGWKVQFHEESTESQSRTQARVRLGYEWTCFIVVCVQLGYDQFVSKPRMVWRAIYSGGLGQGRVLRTRTCSENLDFDLGSRFV